MANLTSLVVDCSLPPDDPNREVEVPFTDEEQAEFLARQQASIAAAAEAPTDPITGLAQAITAASNTEEIVTAVKDWATAVSETK